jgi:hypothetical protein
MCDMKTSGCCLRYLCKEVVPLFAEPKMKKLGLWIFNGLESDIYGIPQPGKGEVL